MNYLQYRHVIVNVAQITGLSIFFQQPVDTNNKENIKASHHWSFVREPISNRWNPLTKGNQYGKRFHVTTILWWAEASGIKSNPDWDTDV